MAHASNNSTLCPVGRVFPAPSLTLPDLSTQHWLMCAIDMMMTRQHIITYQNVESWKRFYFLRVGFIVAQLNNRYVAHRMLANVIKLLCILLKVITRQTRNEELETEWNRIETPHIWWKHWTSIYLTRKLWVNESIEETTTSQNNIQFNSVQLCRCSKTAPILRYSGCGNTF